MKKHTLLIGAILLLAGCRAKHEAMGTLERLDVAEESVKRGHSMWDYRDSLIDNSVWVMDSVEMLIGTDTTSQKHLRAKRITVTANRRQGRRAVAMDESVDSTSIKSTRESMRREQRTAQPISATNAVGRWLMILAGLVGGIFYLRYLHKVDRRND